MDKDPIEFIVYLVEEFLEIVLSIICTLILIVITTCRWIVNLGKKDRTFIHM